MNVRLARLTGLLHVLDANVVGGGGRRHARRRDACRATVVTMGACLLAAAAMSPACLYRLVGDVSAFTFYAGCAVNFALASYKAAAMVSRSRRMRRCVDVAASAFMRARRAPYAAATFARWRRRSVRATYAYVTMAACVTLGWAATSRAPRAAVVTVPREDGTRAAYRLGVFNSFPMVSDRTYNDNYDAFYAIELTVFLCYMYCTVLFDVLVISLCMAFACQLDAVCEAIRSLGYDDTSTVQLLPHDDNEKKEHEQMQNVTKLGEKINVINDLKTIIEDQQSVMNKLEDYYNIIRSVMLCQIFVTSTSHVTIWFVATMSFSNFESNNSMITIKLFTALPMFTVQLIMTCYLFECINEKKDEIIFSLYSSNWTDMDLKSKKLILCLMKVNNANQLKLRVTRTKIVNLEMFTQTMRVCYSIFSMMIKYKKNKRR